MQSNSGSSDSSASSDASSSPVAGAPDAAASGSGNWLINFAKVGRDLSLLHSVMAGNLIHTRLNALIAQAKVQ